MHHLERPSGLRLVVEIDKLVRLVIGGTSSFVRSHLPQSASRSISTPIAINVTPTTLESDTTPRSLAMCIT